MKASKLLSIIRKDIKDYPIEYLKNKVTDERYKDPLRDIGYYFDMYAGGDDENKKFTENITLYLVLISKKPIHPYSENKKDDVYYFNGSYYCKGRIKYIKDKNSLCRYCICKNVGFQAMF